MKYFESSVINGEFDELEKYFLGFTKLEDNKYSTKIFFEIRKQKYLEALDRDDGCVALEILRNDLRIFETINSEVYSELLRLLTLKNIREFGQLSHYGDTKSARAEMLTELKQLIKANPVFQDKLQLPALENSRLNRLINQSLNWQHENCKYSKESKSIPDIDTLFVDHACNKPIAGQSLSPVVNLSIGSTPKVGGLPLLAPHSSVQVPPRNSFEGYMGNSRSICMSSKNNEGYAASTKFFRTPLNSHPPQYQTGHSGHVRKRPRHLGLSGEVNNPPVSISSITYPRRSTSDVLPKTVVAKLNQGSAVKSMDFHPFHPTTILVGTNTGDLAIWEVNTGKRLLLIKFEVWDIEKCKPTLQANLATEYSASVNRVMWSPNGALIGTAYSKDIVHLYAYHGGEDLETHLEIDAHVGNVTDIGFASPSDDTLCIVTCGEDKTIKVWDVIDGTIRHVFEGHEAPISSISLHAKDNLQFIFSTGIDGNLKAWLYDNLGPRMSYKAPGHSCTAITYSTDGRRLFTCGTTEERESFIVEWNETEGSVIRKYRGLGKSPVGVANFDTSKWFLAAGDEFAIKVWDMDSANVLATIDAGGGLPASPSIRFNKEGTLLGVSTEDDGIKILANADGIKLVQYIEKLPVIGTGSASSSAAGTTSLNGDVRVLSEPNEQDNSIVWKL